MSQYRSQNVSSIFLNQGVTCPSSLESLQACGRRHCLGTQARWLPHACSSSSPVSGPAVGTSLGHPDTHTLVDSLFRRDQLQGGAEVGPRCSPGNATRRRGAQVHPALASLFPGCPAPAHMHPIPSEMEGSCGALLSLPSFSLRRFGSSTTPAHFLF